jgi:hypothetical protein
MGFWPLGKKVNLYSVIPHQIDFSEGILNSHSRAFTGCTKVTLIKKVPAEENLSLSRRALTFLHRFLGPLLIYFPISLLLMIYRIAAFIQNYWKKAPK